MRGGGQNTEPVGFLYFVRGGASPPKIQFQDSRYIIVNLLYIRKRTPWYMMFKCKYLQKLSTVSGQGVDNIDIDVQNRRLFQRKTTPPHKKTHHLKWDHFKRQLHLPTANVQQNVLSFQRGSVQTWLNNQKSRDYLWRTYTCLAIGTSPIGNISTHSRKGWLFQLSTCSNSWEFIRVSKWSIGP